MPVKLCPPRRSLWSKAFVMERERFDGADVAHLIQALGPELDWDRLLRRFGPHWRVLLAHLVLFGFIYPSQRDRIPARVLHELTDRLRKETDSTVPQPRSARGRSSPGHSTWSTSSEASSRTRGSNPGGR